MNTGWFKATSSSDNSSCVKVRFEGSAVLLGDTKNDRLGDREPVIRLSDAQWDRVLDAVSDHRPGARNVSLAIDGALDIVIDSVGNTTMTAGGTELSFTSNELDAFLDGVHNAEFTRPALTPTR